VRLAIDDPHHAGVGGQPQRAVGVGNDAKDTLDAGRQCHRLQLAIVVAVQPAVERAHPQSALAVISQRGDRRTLQFRHLARAQRLEALTAVPYQSAIGGRPDGAIGLLCNRQHRALRQLVLVPDVAEVRDGAIRGKRMQRQGGTKKCRQRARQYDMDAPGPVQQPHGIPPESREDSNVRMCAPFPI